ncbi:MAG: YaeQ family protein [Candidatus Obscuribacterales bacterium]|nr:YaeQ family protein [Candidatus Obscuribacterales bacterium]
MDTSHRSKLRANLKYTFNIQISDNKKALTEKLIIAAFENESGGHVVLKLLAYLLFIEQRPHIDEDAGWHFTPDLIARDDSGSITLWIDCGRVSMKKVDTIATKVRNHIDFYVFRKTQREMQQFYQAIKDKIKHLDNVKCVSFDDEFIDGISANLDRTNNIECYIGDDMVTLTLSNSLGQHEAYSSIHRITSESVA